MENAFGILACRWRLFMKPITATPKSATIFTQACIVLHNFLTARDTKYAHEYGDYFKEGGGIVGDQWRQDTKEVIRIALV